MTAQSIGSLAEKIVADADPYAWWRAALENPERIGRSLQIHVNEPQMGFYVKPFRKGNEKRKPDGPHPVAIWRDEDGAMRAAIGADYKPVDAEWIWTWVAEHPIQHELYEQIINGGDWPQEYLKAAEGSSVSKKEPDQPPDPVEVMNRPNHGGTPGIGHNRGPAMGDDLAAKIKAETTLARKLMDDGVEDQETADKLGETGNRLLELKKLAQAEHDDLKAPYLEMCGKIDEAYNPAIKVCADVIKKARGVIGAWKEREKERLRQAAELERRRREQEERERYEREKAAAEEEARQKQAEADRKAREQAELAGASPDEVAQITAAPVKVKEVKPVKEVKAKKAEVKAGAATGRAFSGGPKRYVAKIVDYPAFLAAIQGEKEIVEAANKIAHRIANTKDAEIPVGMERHEEAA